MRATWSGCRKSGEGAPQIPYGFIGVAIEHLQNGNGAHQAEIIAASDRGVEEIMAKYYR